MAKGQRRRRGSTNLCTNTSESAQVLHNRSLGFTSRIPVREGDGNGGIGTFDVLHAVVVAKRKRRKKEAAAKRSEVEGSAKIVPGHEEAASRSRLFAVE
jgi:hypothetical protein